MENEKLLVEKKTLEEVVNESEINGINKNYMTQCEFDSKYEKVKNQIHLQWVDERDCQERLKKRGRAKKDKSGIVRKYCEKSCKCTRRAWLNRLHQYLPMTKWLPNYKFKEDIVGDLVAGMTVAIMQIPQGMAYAMLAEVAPIYGLYSSFFPVLIYVLFATSNHVSPGTFAITSLMTGGCITRIINTRDDLVDNELTRINIATLITLLNGLFQLILGVLHLGIISIYLSEPQLPGLLGLTIKKHSGIFKLIHNSYGILSNIHRSNCITVVVAIVCIGAMIICKESINKPFKQKMFMPIPIELIVVILSTTVSYVTGISDKFGVSVLEYVPKGLPSVTLMNWNVFNDVISSSISIAIIGYAMSYSLADLFAKKYNYRISANQELIAIGLANCFGSFFSCIPMGASISRTLVQVNAGCRTLLTNVFSSIILFFVLIFLGPLFEPLPKTTLSAIVIVALKGMMLKIIDVGEFFKTNGIEGSIWLITFLSTAILDVTYGLIIGLLATFLLMIIRTQTQNVIELIKIDGVYVNKDFYENVDKTNDQSIRIIRYEDNIYFPNVHVFKRSLLKLFNICPEGKNKISCTSSNNLLPTKIVDYVILDASAISYIDRAGIKVLVSLIEIMETAKIQLVLAACQSSMLYRLEQMGFNDKLLFSPIPHIFPTIDDAVNYRVNTQDKF
ncbi:hypothetical protein SNEBB_010428 [Seison nebaliae]|nr:hypothetical protein SNEBB_010428 [Seison nebaliae]